MKKKTAIVGGQAIRVKIRRRYDLITPEFLDAMAEILGWGAERYGEYNWQKGLPADKSGINHALKHIMEYKRGDRNEFGDHSPRMHLAQAAVNLMFEFFHGAPSRIGMSEKAQKLHDCIVNIVKINPFDLLEERDDNSRPKKKKKSLRNKVLPRPRKAHPSKMQ